MYSKCKNERFMYKDQMYKNKGISQLYQSERCSISFKIQPCANSHSTSIRQPCRSAHACTAMYCPCTRAMAMQNVPTDGRRRQMQRAKCRPCKCRCIIKMPFLRLSHRCTAGKRSSITFNLARHAKTGQLASGRQNELYKILTETYMLVIYQSSAQLQQSSQNQLYGAIHRHHRHVHVH